LQGEAGILAEQEREAMNDASRQEHWEHVYTTKGESEVSWFQENATPSLELMTLTGATPRSAVIARRHQHMTPWGSEQRFQFSVFRRALGG
jgi:hypothetical protein